MRKNIIYIGIILIMTVLVSVMCFSYAFFTHKIEDHGKLNIVAGTLNYKLENNKLENNNSITVPSGLTQRIDLKIISLNDIDSKYELYYITNNNDIEVNYTSTSIDNPTGTIEAKSTKTVSIRINNKSEEDATVTFSVAGGFINNSLVLNEINHINALCDNETTFCISTKEQLITLANEVNSGDNKAGKTYYLENDLDLGGKFDSEGNMLEGSTNWTPIGNYATFNPFAGTFDGDGHVIRKIYMDTGTFDRSGLFGYINNGVIRKIGIEDSYIKNPTIGTAAIAGVSDKSTIELCYNKATISGQKNTGGLVVLNRNSEIKNSYNIGNVKGVTQFAGGIVGYNDSNGLVTNCYNAGTIYVNGYNSGGISGGNIGKINKTYNLGIINGNVADGGITGQFASQGEIHNSYNTGTVSGNSGGIIGIIYGNQFQLSDNYYLDTSAANGVYDTSGANIDGTVSALTINEMPSILSVVNNDNAFTEDTLNINNGNPVLKWELQYK